MGDGSGSGGAWRRPPADWSWRAVAAAAAAVWLVPVVLALALLWLPLLCCAVAALRFRRVRKQLMLGSSARGCRGGGARWREAAAAETETAGARGARGDRLRLLHQYLDDQMELVAAAGGTVGDSESGDERGAR